MCFPRGDSRTSDKFRYSSPTNDSGNDNQVVSLTSGCGKKNILVAVHVCVCLPAVHCGPAHGVLKVREKCEVVWLHDLRGALYKLQIASGTLRSGELISTGSVRLGQLLVSPFH